MNTQPTFSTLNTENWNRILSRPAPAWRAPLTVNLPIHPAHSTDFLHVSCALNVVRRRVFPNMRSLEEKSMKIESENEAMVVQFALGDVPFVPDLNLTGIHLLEDRWPVARAGLSCWNLYYEFEYAARSLDDGQTLLSIRVAVTNEGKQARDAHVWTRVHFPVESRFFKFHYVPFDWNRTRWEGEVSGVSFEKGSLFRDGQRFGRIAAGPWDVSWVDKLAVDSSKVNQLFTGHEPYYVRPMLRLDQILDTLHARTHLGAGERREFTILLLTEEKKVSPGHLSALDKASADSVREASVSHFKSLIPESAPVIAGSAGGYDTLIKYLPLNTLQLLVDFKDGGGWLPTQGGSTERYYVWVWEAVAMLRPMLALGYFKPVREALRFIFSLQDGGCPPQGEFTTVEGAIGTTGPRWLNATGSALGLAADYAALSGDAEFTDTMLPKMLRAADWLVGELRATRKLDREGKRPLTYGLLPFGHGTDGDVGHALSLSDTYSLWGLDRLTRMLEDRKHSRATEMRKETEQYRQDLALAITRLARPDGFIDRKIVTGRKDEIYTDCFEHVCGAIHYVATGALSVDSDVFKRYEAYFERHLADGYFTGSMYREIVYIGLTEALWHETWLRAGEWKKAFAAMQSTLKYGITQDTHLTQERFSKQDPAFTCWQPNGSGNGRLLDMILKSYYFEYQDGVRGPVSLILGGIPWAWLESNQTTSLHHLRTRNGMVSVVATPSGKPDCFKVEIHRTKSSGSLLRFPDFLAAIPMDPGVVSTEPGYFLVPPTLESAVFLISKVPC